jgi:hypothetical protein
MSATHHVIRATVLGDIAAERRRQIEVEGWTPAHDDEHAPGVLAQAAACYAIRACKPKNDLRYGQGSSPPGWPWDAKWWKPTTDRRDLIKAAALIVAEIERLDRANPQEDRHD